AEKQVLFLSLFDSPNVNACYRRDESVVPQQALAMANSPIVLDGARLLARDLSRSAGTDEAFIVSSFERVLGRSPSDEERSACSGCGRVPRRAFLADLGMGFTGLALGAMLHRDGIVKADEPRGWSPPDGRPHFTPRAKNVIWLFMVGGTSHVESFDPKPELAKYAGKTIAESPHKAVLDSPYTKKNVREFVAGLHPVQP